MTWSQKTVLTMILLHVRSTPMGETRLPSMSATESLILDMLRRRERYGLELVDSSKGKLKRGSVYVTLARMESKGFVESRQEERPQGAIGLPRRLYRATEYGFLFVLLTFAAFVLVEVIWGVRLHPVQYALAGLALAVFFLLLIALSEHVRFVWAYVAAAGSCVALLAYYLRHPLGSGARSTAFAALFAALYAALYSELHRVASRELNRQGWGVSLGATSLLHEAYFDLSRRDGAAFPDRARFMAYAARVMRGLIVDYARNKQAQKRGGQFELTALSTDTLGVATAAAGELVRISDALDDLSSVEAILAEVVDLKYFCGFSFERAFTRTTSITLCGASNRGIGSHRMPSPITRKACTASDATSATCMASLPDR